MIRTYKGLSQETTNVSATDLDVLEQKNKGLVLGTGFGYRMPNNFLQVIETDKDIQPIYQEWQRIRAIGTKYISNMKASISAGAVTPPDYNYIDALITEAGKMRDAVITLLQQKYTVEGSVKGSTGNYVAKPSTVTEQQTIGSAEIPSNITSIIQTPIDTVANMIPDKNISDGFKKVVPYALGGLVLYNMFARPLIPLLALGGVYLFNANKDKTQLSATGCNHE